MEFLIFEESSQVDRAASNWFRQNVQAIVSLKRTASVFIPAGNTPIGLYDLWEKEKPDYLHGLELVQIDDVLTGNKKEFFRSFLKTHLPTYAPQIQFVDEANRGADLGFLGLGLNGHVAFHEPGLHQSFYSGCVKLSEVTQKNLGAEAGSWGVSYGIGAFLECKALLMVVKGQAKQGILKKLLARDASLPATHLLAHLNLTIIVDRDAHKSGAP